MGIRATVCVYVCYLVFQFLYYGYHLAGEQSPSVTIFDVGQGDAILITTPNHRRILIDGGDNFDIDAYLNKHFLLQPCYIDVVVLTHPHSDHLVGLQRLVQHCTIGQTFFNVISYDSTLYATWLGDMAHMNTHSIVSGDSFSVDGVTFTALWPTEDYISTPLPNTNITSVVLLMHCPSFTALFTGDAELGALTQLDISLFDDKLPLDLYKVAHHGSFNGLDVALVNELVPAISIISVGAQNNFGHPDDRVLDFLESIGSVLYRTDLAGSIEVLY